MNPDGWPSQAVRSVPGRPNPSMSPAYDDCREIAREALAGPDTPAEEEA